MNDFLNRIKEQICIGNASIGAGLIAAYRAGAENMRKRAAEECRMLHAIHTPDCGREPNCAGLIRNLPVGESSQAPEGTKP